MARLEVRALGGRPAEVRTPEMEHAFIQVWRVDRGDSTPQFEHALAWLDYRWPANGLLAPGEMHFVSFAPAVVEGGR
jgi:hypothetical protein